MLNKLAAGLTVPRISLEMRLPLQTVLSIVSRCMEAYRAPSREALSEYWKALIEDRKESGRACIVTEEDRLLLEEEMHRIANARWNLR